VKCPSCGSDNPDTSRYCGNCAAVLAVPDQPTVSVVTPRTGRDAVEPGTLVAGKYRIVSKIGQGGMGLVYKAEDVTLGRHVALKFLPPAVAGSAEVGDRFVVEARAAAALSHPNICVVHEVGSADGQAFIAMEHVEGETLRELI
jgi:serine/threonine protein kinase